MFCGVGAFGAFGHWLLILAHARAPAAILSPFIYTQIIWMLALGYLVFGDWPDRWTLVGAGIVIASGLYLLSRERIRGVDANDRPNDGARGAPRLRLENPSRHSGTRPMPKTEILMTAPMLPARDEARRGAVQAAPAVEATDREAFLKEVGPRIRGVASSGGHRARTAPSSTNCRTSRSSRASASATTTSTRSRRRGAASS